MKKVNNIVYRFRLKLLLLRNSIYRKTHTFINELIIVSSDKYKNKVKEDINLCYYLMKNGINSEIKSWKEIDSKSNIVIRSVWGYQHELEEFNKFLSKRKGITINDVDILNKNISKKEQYDLFQKYDIDCIDTKFVYKKEDIKIKNKSVIKPIVSASGNKTYIVNDIKDVDKIEDINNGYMLQPFIEEINNGEYSIILFDHNIKYGIIRYPGVFTKQQSVEYVDKSALSEDIINIVINVNKIIEYKNSCFARVDIVDNKVIEIELLDPQLFLETIPDKDLRKEMYGELVDCLKKKL